MTIYTSSELVIRFYYRLRVVKSQDELVKLVDYLYQLVNSFPASLLLELINKEMFEICGRPKDSRIDSLALQENVLWVRRVTDQH